MPDTRPPTSSSPGAPSRRTWWFITALLLPAMVVPLVVPWYDSTDPKLFGFPFYYWFQMAMIPLAVVLTVIAYYLAKGADRRDREARERARDGEAGR